MSAADGAKDDFLSRIWSICTTLTEEAMAVASAKAKELGFDPNRGLVPLPESFINLSSARSIIEDAIEKQKLVQLPITVQKELLVNLESIAKSLQGLASGVDEVVNLTTAIEALNTAIWKYRLHNLSDQVLGYQKKLNQLKNQNCKSPRSWLYSKGRVRNRKGKCRRWRNRATEKHCCCTARSSQAKRGFLCFAIGASRRCQYEGGRFFRYDPTERETEWRIHGCHKNGE